MVVFRGHADNCKKDVPIQLVGETFIYLEEDLPSGVDYQTTQSTTSVGRDEITHVDETALPAVAPSAGEGASQAPSVSLSMDLDSKQMVDDLVNSETTGENGDVNGPALADAPPGKAESLRLRSSQATHVVGNDTSYGLIGSGTAREYFGDQPPGSPRPLLPSIDKSPFALQPGEQTPGSRPGTAKRMTPSHSQNNSQTGFPLQQIHYGFNIESSTPSIMSDPTQQSRLTGGHSNQPFLNSTFPVLVNYTSGGRTSTDYENGTSGGFGFRSSEIVSQGGSGTVRAANTNYQTPPNGQDAG